MKATVAALCEPLEEVVAAAVFKAEVEAWAKRIGVHPREIRLRPMKRKWASCSSNGRVAFHAELLPQPARLRAETAVHQMVHLKVPNHGKLFPALPRTHLAGLGQ
jgi:predicted metal-dependent hydrolase